jgi:ribosomal protein S12 methylthiotransferase accessory factor
MSSNGLASGNHVLEAICHGLGEVIERDALALWASRGGARYQANRVDLSSVTAPQCRRLLDHLRSSGMVVGVWDITTDIGVPAFVCCLVDQEDNPFAHCYSSHGSGCHPTKEIALSRALTEAAQTRLTYIAGTRDDAHREIFETARNPDRVANARREIEVLPPGEGKTWSDIADHPAESFNDDLSFILARLAHVGAKQVAVVEFPPRIAGIHVVRVIVPGLEGLHDAPGYVPGRRARAVLEGGRG